jgi:UDP-N-acetylmuramoyl-tripeptide--D-alanyl-D-alanine ligase
VIPLSLAEVAAVAPGKLEAAEGADRVTGVKIDSRRVQAGDLFVAVGRGVEFTRDALARGAAAALIPEDAFRALAALARTVRERSSARAVGVTGSIAKTSTKDILGALCRPHRRTVVAEGSQNNEIGLPLTLCRIEEDTEIVILEMGMRGLGQIAALCETARPDVGVITKIGPVHLELLGTIERVAEAKAELVHALPPGGTAVVPAGDAHLEPYLNRDDVELIRFGTGGDIQLKSFTPSRDESDLEIEAFGRTLTLTFSFASRYNATNALAALAAYHALGLPFDEAYRGAANVKLSRWRGEETPLPGDGLLINDAYNANPVSMRAALDHLAERAQGRRTVAILGDMAELGEGSPELHAEVGRAARVDVLLAVGALSRHYDGTHWVETVEEALPLLDDLLRPGDAILVKASRAMGLERIADAVQGARV